MMTQSKNLFVAFHVADLLEEIPGDEISFLDGKAIERIRCFGDIEEFAV